MKSELHFTETKVFIRAEAGRVFFGVVHPLGNVMPELGIDQATLLAGELERAVLAARRQKRAAQAAYHCAQAQRGSHA